MKKTLSKIFGVAVVIALLASMIIAVVPAAALSYSGSGVTVGNPTISGRSSYTIKFAVTFNLVANDTITVTFPPDTTVPDESNFNANPTSIMLNSTAVGLTATSVPLARTVTITVPGALNVGDIQVLEFDSTVNNASSIVNPSSPGTYSLTLATNSSTGSTIESAVSSPAYTIGIPTVVSSYNQAGNFVGSNSTLQEALNNAQSNYTIKMGPGTYAEKVYLTGSISHVTITTSGSAADTILSITSGDAMLTLGAATSYITVDNVTINGQLANAGANNTVQNCVINFPGGPALPADTTGSEQVALAGTLVTNTGENFTLTNTTVDATANGNANQTTCLAMNDDGGGTVPPASTISNDTFKLTQTSGLQQDVAIAAGNTTNFTASGCTFTGSSGTGYTDYNGAKATFKNNTYTSVQNAVILSAATGSKLTFQGNTVNTCTSPAKPNATGAIVISTAPTSLVITGNTISGGAGYSMMISAIGADGTYAIIGNNMSGNALGFKATVGDAYELNYWGSSGGPNATGSDVTSDSTVSSSDFTPYLSAPASYGEATVIDTSVNASPSPLLPSDSQTAVGITITGYTASADGYVSGLSLGTNNPQTIQPPFPAIAYYDVYNSAASNTNMQINLYASGITDGTNAYYWSGATGNWVLCSNQGVAGTGGYVYVNVGTYNGTTTSPALSDMTGTYFVLVSGLPPAKASFSITSPAQGSTTTLTNVPFAWDAVAAATSYHFVLSSNADMSSPIATQDLNGTGYIYTGTLNAGPYYWQVTAYQTNQIIGVSETGTFIAAAPTTTAVTTPAPSTTITLTQVPPPTFTITQPQPTTVTISQPPVTEVTPAWIWGIIGIGAVLIIVVIVLIVRTRRTV